MEIFEKTKISVKILHSRLEYFHYYVKKFFSYRFK